MSWLLSLLLTIELRRPATRVKVMVAVVAGAAVKAVVNSNEEVEVVILTWLALIVRASLKPRVMVRVGRVVSLPSPRGINAIIVTKLELSILISVTVRFVYAAIVIRMTTRMVFTVRVIP